MNSIIPTVFATSQEQFKERFNKILPLTKNIQIDFMDGSFVKSKSIQISKIPDLKKFKKNFEAHLMIFHPEKYINTIKNKGFKKIIFHLESTKYPLKLINQIKKEKLKVFIAINPETQIKSITPYLSQVNGILFLGVYPGKEHQLFIPLVYTKIKKLRKLDKKIIIQVDGGVNEKNASKLAKLGVNIINSGSFISDSYSPKEAFKKLNYLFKNKRKILHG